jgi:hypothetical protein
LKPLLLPLGSRSLLFGFFRSSSLSVESLMVVAFANPGECPLSVGREPFAIFFFFFFFSFFFNFFLIIIIIIIIIFMNMVCSLALGLCCYVPVVHLLVVGLYDRVNRMVFSQILKIKKKKKKEKRKSNDLSVFSIK